MNSGPEPQIFKSQSISPESIRAADSDEFVFTLVIGKDYTSQPSRIVFDFSSTLGTSCPTRQVNEASGYVEAYVNNPDVEYDIKCWDLDYNHFIDKTHTQSREAARMVVLDLSAGLKEGDVVELHWGETLGGFGPGAKVSSVVPRPGYKARVDIRYFDSQEKGMPDHGRDYEGYTRPVPDYVTRLEYEIRPRELKRMRLIRKNSGAMLIPYDVFWNIAKLEESDFEADSPFTENCHGVLEFKNKNVSIVTRSAPLTSSSVMDNVFEDKNIFWGDIHTHSMYSNDCFQRSGMDMTPADLMDFARYRSGLDFFAVTDHHQPKDTPDNHIGEDRWKTTLHHAEEKNMDGNFVVFPGIEFRCIRGDTVVIFNGYPTYKEITNPETTDIRKVWESIKSCDFITIPHLHTAGGELPEEEWFYPENPDLEPVLELFSDHGSYEREKIIENGRAWCKAFRWDRCAEYFLKNGYKYGLVANSDDHKGHVGVNGLTAVYSEELTRDALFAAYRKRNVYASTNARIRLLFTANGQLMGSIMPDAATKEFFIDVKAENDLKKVEIFKDGELYKMFPADGKNFSMDLAVRDSGPGNWYVRATQKDNHIAWSSPVWFE